MTTTLPATIELCQRIRDGLPCLGRVHRSGVPEVACCTACGKRDAGAIYVQRERIVAQAVLYLAETLATNHPHLAEAYRHAAVNLKAVLESGVEYQSLAALTTPGKG